MIPLLSLCAGCICAGGAAMFHAWKLGSLTLGGCALAAILAGAWLAWEILKARVR